MVVCVLLPRLELQVALGDRGVLASGPVAVAPQPGREQRLGPVSGAAEAFGIRAGMALGEALARCPQLMLVAGDPIGVAETWEGVIGALEGIGALVESERPGVACFEASGLRGLHGGSEHHVIAAARGALRLPARIGAGPTRFCALAAATRARSRRSVVVSGGARAVRAYLAPLPVALLRSRVRTSALVEPLEQLGLRTLGALAELSRHAVADRFGADGVLAQRLVRGFDEPLAASCAVERIEETLELAEDASGPQLERALDLLIERLLARRERRGRTLRAAILAARLVGGGTWRERVVFREPLAEATRMRLALAPRLATLPAPAEALHLGAERFGPPTGDQRSLLEQAAGARRARLHEAIEQVRAAAGPDAALRVLGVDLESRIPERRVVLAPFEA